MVPGFCQCLSTQTRATPDVQDEFALVIRKLWRKGPVSDGATRAKHGVQIDTGAAAVPVVTRRHVPTFAFALFGRENCREETGKTGASSKSDCCISHHDAYLRASLPL